MDERFSREEIYDTKDWAITLFLLTVPIINIIFIIKWGFVDGRDPRKSFIKGYLIVILSYVSIGLLMILLVYISSNSISFVNNNESSPEIYFYEDSPNAIEIINSELVKENDTYRVIYQFQVNIDKNLKYIFTDIEILDSKGFVIYSDTIDSTGSFKSNQKYSVEKYLGYINLEDAVLINQKFNQVWVE